MSFKQFLKAAYSLIVGPASSYLFKTLQSKQTWIHEIFKTQSIINPVLSTLNTTLTEKMCSQELSSFSLFKCLTVPQTLNTLSYTYSFSLSSNLGTSLEVPTGEEETYKLKK